MHHVRFPATKRLEYLKNHRELCSLTINHLETCTECTDVSDGTGLCSVGLELCTKAQESKARGKLIGFNFEKNQAE